MMIHKKSYLPGLFVLLAALTPFTASADWVWSPELGKFVSPKDDEVRDNSSQQFDYALELYKLKQYDKAAEELETLVKTFPTSRAAPEAQYRLGTIYEEKGDYYKALKAYQKMIEVYPQNDRFEEVIEREFKLGNLFLSGKKGKIFGVEIRPAFPIAMQAFEHILKHAPYGTFGDQAQFNLALAQKKAGQFDSAMQSFQDLLDNYPQSELVEKARYELTETSYFRSIAQYRDERALESASQQVQGFIENYPGAPGTEKVAKIREEIDEKNAEKNYQIGLYYEKDNYVQSAIIYYKDVAKRYPHTVSGAKAENRLRALEQPVKFLTSEKDALTAELDDAKRRLAAMDDSTDSFEREAMERKMERLEKRMKSLEKEKGDSVSRLTQDLERRENELKQKFKNLDKKIEKYKNNDSEDFQKAIERWRASLEAERDAINEEKQQLAGWRSELGVGRPFYEGWMPFTGEPKTPLEEVQAVDAKELYKLSEKKQKTLDEKETLYKQHHEVLALINGTAVEEVSRADSKISENSPFAQKLAQYAARFGSDDWLVGLRKQAGLAVSKIMINPFKDTSYDSMSDQELLELRLHLREKVGAAQNVVDTLSTAFNDELALMEQERLAEKLESSDTVDLKELRKEIKKVERDIRSRYESIEDRDKHKAQLLDELDHMIGSKADKSFAEKTGETLLLPVKVTRVFLFGRDNAPAALTHKAGKSNDASVQKLKQEIETEGLMIQAQALQIEQLEQNLEILKAQASLSGGNQFRSAMVKVPYVFIEDAIDNAEKLISPEDRQELLLERLSQKTQELESLKRELAKVDAAVAKLSQNEDQIASLESEVVDSNSNVDKASMRTEIEKLTPAPIAQNLPSMKPAEVTDADPKHLKELREIEESLAEVIEDQIDLEAEEKKILEKRINEADVQLQKTSSKAMRGDLLMEREKLEDRVVELTQQRDFLEKEVARILKSEG